MDACFKVRGKKKFMKTSAPLSFIFLLIVFFSFFFLGSGCQEKESNVFVTVAQSYEQLSGCRAGGHAARVGSRDGDGQKRTRKRRHSTRPGKEEKKTTEKRRGGRDVCVC